LIEITIGRINNMQVDRNIVGAFEFAFDAHKNHTRKGTDIPYICHLMDVASILMKNNVESELVIAGLLHDVVEDSDIALSDIEDKFGRNVMVLVKGASEPGELRKEGLDPKDTWRERKQHTIDFIIDAGRGMKLLSCADKLSNVRDLLNDFQIEGDELWKRFNAGKEDQAWYYTSILEAFSRGEDISDTEMYKEFKTSVERLFGK
jgi:(p)ppGpp synthase/HD superfamily hydrolase